MNTKNINKKVLFITGLFVLVIAFSSCNRGYGCPYELKNVVKLNLPTSK